MVFTHLTEAPVAAETTGLLPSPNYIVRTGSRQKISSNIPSHEQLMAVKRKKKLLATGTEHFNSKPKKGIQFLQDQNLLSTPLDPVEVVTYLKENPYLDKKMIGEYISNRTNLNVLDCFVKDRVQNVWQNVRDHIYTLLMGSAASNHHFLVERSVVGLLRLGIRLMRREDMSFVVLQSLRMLLLLKSSTLSRVSRQVSYGLFELLKTSAANIHSATDWAIIFTLLECVGAGAPPPRVVGKQQVAASHETGAKSDGDIGTNQSAEDDSGLGNERNCTSDSEVTRSSSALPTANTTRTTSPELSPNSGGGWILVGREGEIQPMPVRTSLSSQLNMLSERELMCHDPFSLVKCCESLAFLVRDVAHITPYNFENCVRCIRTFVEASLESVEKRGGGKRSAGKENGGSGGKGKKKMGSLKRRGDQPRANSPTNSAYDADESDSEEMPSGYHQVSIQLLDLMHTLHTRTAQIYRWWAEENAETELASLWTQGWCPLLQGIARLCCDSRRQVRMSAITYLQRALLVHDLQTLTGDEWESCFSMVLFPLLSKLTGGPFSPAGSFGAA
ncbi:hypothetical protein LSTR_LSTR014152 [Laodelphax striatellus]|uniref:SEC7 domain-containing protein n=1 Tax=Laodelphax striatellus TaxID=195883 RepID=A0A482X000_LAOST|nr:hypothetical protein LSTR_LSTR014152 [Laodelphax striatellus]